MIIYTGDTDLYCGCDFNDMYEVPLNGSSRLLVRPAGNQRAVVVRLISSDPVDYLNPRLMPGAEIEFTVTGL